VIELTVTIVSTAITYVANKLALIIGNVRLCGLNQPESD
jgi:hypothetical protein